MGGAAALISGTGISRKLHLHAHALWLPHPRKGEIRVTAPLPPHMATSFSFFGFDPKIAGEPFVSFQED